MAHDSYAFEKYPKLAQHLRLIGSSTNVSMSEWIRFLSDLYGILSSLEEWRLAIDQALILNHIGTHESFADAKTALNALLSHEQSVGAYHAAEMHVTPDMLIDALCALDDNPHAPRAYARRHRINAAVRRQQRGK